MCLSSCLKCSVSCGTGIQVRKIECISGQSGGGGVLVVGGGGFGVGIGMDVGSNGSWIKDGNLPAASNIKGAGADGPTIVGSGGGGSGAAAVAECNLNTKPTETQQCTTGIVCSSSDDETEDGSDEHYDNEHISSEVLVNVYTQSL